MTNALDRMLPVEQSTCFTSLRSDMLRRAPWFGRQHLPEKRSLAPDFTSMITFRIRLPLFCMIAAGLASCVPRPHISYLRPAVVGIIVEDKKPIADIGLFMGKYPGENDPCTEVGESVSVAADGRFSWEPIQARRLVESLINPGRLTGAITALCIRHPQQGILVGAMLFMMQDKPLSIRLDCDVARPIPSSAGPHTFSALVGQSQYCEASEVN